MFWWIELIEDNTCTKNDEDNVGIDASHWTPFKRITALSYAFSASVIFISLL